MIEKIKLAISVKNLIKLLNYNFKDLDDRKVEKIGGQGLSTNDFTDAFKAKLEGIEDTAQVNLIESISIDGVNQPIDDNKNIDFHQPKYSVVTKTPSDKNEKEYNLTIDGEPTGLTIEVPKDIFLSKVTLKYATAVDEPYKGAKINDAYLQFDRENDETIYAPIPELQIHAGQDIMVDENNVISTVIPIPRKLSELQNDNFTVTDEHYVHTDNNFTDEYINRIDTTISSLDTKVDDNKKETDSDIYNLNTKVDNNKKSIDKAISDLSSVVDNSYTTLDTKIDNNKSETDKAISDLADSLDRTDKSSVKDVTYNKSTQKITVTFGDKTTKILTLEELLMDCSYDGDTGNFTFTRANGEPVVVNTPKENFLSDVQYNGETKIITFTMTSGSTFEVNVSDLVDVYTVQSTNSVEMNVTEGNKISSDVKLSSTAENILSVETDGLYAKHQDISHLAMKDAVDTELAKKVDKETGKSLLDDTEIARLKTLKNYDDTIIIGDITALTETVDNNYTTLDTKIDTNKTNTDKAISDLTVTVTDDKKATDTALDTKADKSTVNTLSGDVTNLTARVTANEKNIATKQDKLTAGTGIEITENNVINNTQTSAEWGNIIGDITTQTDLVTELDKKQDTISDLLTIRAGASKGETAVQPSQLHDGKLTIKANDIEVATFTANQSTDVEANISIPDSATWGSIIGTLTDQTDLSTALEKKTSVSLDNITNEGKQVIRDTVGVASDTQIGSVKVDNTTIVTNSEGVITNIATKTKSNTIKIDWEGTKSEYETGRKDGSILDDWYCYITDDKEIVDTATQAFNYGMSTYYKGDMNNASWLKSEGQWNNGEVYNGLYDWITTQQATGVTGFKLSTEEYTDYDFVINTADETFRLPLLNGSEDLPGDEIYTYALPTTSGQKYTALYNGTVEVKGSTTATNQYMQVKNNTSGVYNESRNPISNNYIMETVDVKRGDEFQVTASVIGNVTSLTLSKHQGNGNLYYYAGNTIQNADLIDIGRVTESLTTKIDTDLSNLPTSSKQEITGWGFPSNKYIDLTLNASGSTYTAPADGLVHVTFRGGANSSNYGLNNITVGYSSYAYNINQGLNRLFVLVKKGDVFSVEYTSLSTTYPVAKLRFFYAVGFEPA